MFLSLEYTKWGDRRGSNPRQTPRSATGYQLSYYYNLRPV